MDHHIFHYLPTTRGSSASPAVMGGVSRLPADPGTSPLLAAAAGGIGIFSAAPERSPIRVTPSALQWLIYDILYTIEFLAPVGPRPPPLKEVNRSTLSANVLRAASSFFTRGSTATAATATTAAAPVQSLDDAAEAAALQQQHDQVFVVPVTQVIPQLGDVHVVVCQTHNPTINPAYRQALQDVETILQAHREQLERRRGGAFSSVTGLSSLSSLQRKSEELLCRTALQTSPKAPAVLNEDVASPATRGGRLQEDVICDTSEGPRVPPCPQLHALPSFLPIATTSAATSYRVSTEEVGLELSVRLSASERWWGGQIQKPLMELVFPIVCTKEDSQTTMALSSSPITYAASPESTDGGAATATTLPLPSDTLLVNRPAQIRDAMHFISECFYKALSMDTFTDFMAGELSFDIHVKQKRAFPTCATGR